jgi:hypothetical protein
MENLAAKNPDEVKKLSALYDDWAKRCGVVSPDKLPPVKRIVPAREGGD